VSDCPCPGCAKKPVENAPKTLQLSNKSVFLAFGWLIFAFVAYRAATTEIVEKGQWNPYDILGLGLVSFSHL
jgi:translocation protein SEC63